MRSMYVSGVANLRDSYKAKLVAFVSVLTGAKLISNSTGLKLESITLQDLGSLK